MTPDEHWFPSHLRELEEHECLELLATHRVGRVAYSDALGPIVLPVNYSVDRTTILIQVTPHSTLARQIRDGPASFQIDDFDDYSETGWSVLVRGDASDVEPADLPGEESRPRAWAEGQRTLYLRIVPREISGRRLLPA